MKEIETYELEFPMLEKHNQELLQRIKKLNDEADLLRDIETSAKKDIKDMENQYKLEKKKIENMGLAKKGLEERLQKLKIEHEKEMENLKTLYEKAKEESRIGIKEVSEGYELKMRDLQNEIRGLREDTREKDHQIKELNKGMEIGNTHAGKLQDELNNYKQKFYNLEVKENKAKQRIQDLQQELHRRDSSTEVKELKQYIQQIEGEKNTYLEQIQQKEIELNEIKQSAVMEHNQILEASRQEIMNLGNAEHERIMGEKNKEMQELKEKNSKLEKQYNDLKEEYEYVGEQFEKKVNRAANNKAMMITYEKDQEIQSLRKQINQLHSQQGSQKTEMEIEEPKARPERIEL